MDSYHIKDARNLAKVVSSKVDLIITSPPYFDMKDYGSDNQIGFGQKYADYMTDMRQVLSQCYAVSKESASLWMVVDTLKKDKCYKLLPFDLAREAEKEGWRLQDIIIWKKDKTLPFSKHGEMRNIFEYVLFFVKTDSFKYYPSRITDLNIKEWWVKYPERYSPNGKAQSDVWEFSIPVQGSWGSHYIRHFCPLPADMIRRIISLSSDPGDIVMDPFAGTGAVLAEAKRMGREYIGFDLNDQFREMFYEYVKTVEPDKLGGNSEQEKQVFGSTVQKLRALKWPSAVLKKVRQQNPDSLSNVKGVIVEPGVKGGDSDFKYTFVLSRSDKKLESLINAITARPPFTKYGIKSEIVFARSEPDIKPLWEYRWISTHLSPKPYTGREFPFIASNIVLESNERQLVDAYM
jgi:DNA modification methylase